MAFRVRRFCCHIFLEIHYDSLVHAVNLILCVAPAGRLRICGVLTQGFTLGYHLLPLQGMLDCMN